MHYTEEEIRFLMQGHQVEHAAGTRRELKPIVDLRQLGCPSAIFNRILQDRAYRLRWELAEFRANRPKPSVVTDSLEAQIESARLF